MILALVLSATFQLAPGTVSAECRAFSRQIVSAPPSETSTWLCARGMPCTYARCTPPMTCEATTRPEAVPCEIRGVEVWTPQPGVGDVVIFSVRGVDPNGLKSPWTGGKE